MLVPQTFCCTDIDIIRKGEDEYRLNWEDIQFHNDTKTQLQLSVTGDNRVYIKIGTNLKMVVSRHNERREKFGRSYLGFYILEDQGLTRDAHGLIGE